MLKKIILSVMAVALLTGSESVLANETNAAAGAKQEKQVLQSGVKRGRQQEFDRYFNALTKAYRENDRETIGQMLRKMNQFRQNQQKAKAVPGKRGQDLPKRRGRGMGRQGQGMGGRGQGMGRQGQGMGGQGQGMGVRGRGMGWHGRGVGGRGRGMGWQGRGRGGRGRGMGWQGRGRSGRGRGMGWQGRGIGVRGRGMGWQGQGMGGRGRGIGWQDRGNQRRKMNVPQRDDMAGEEFDWDL